MLQIRVSKKLYNIVKHYMRDQIYDVSYCGCASRLRCGSFKY